MKLRRFTAVALLAAALQCAFAGHWNIQYSGGYSSLYGNTWPDTGGSGGGTAAWGQITATLTWVPDNASDTAPLRIWVLESSHAQANVTTGSSGAADCGLGTTAVTTPWKNGNTTVGTYISSTGKRLLPHKPDNNGVVTTSASPSANGDGGAGVGYSVQVTNKAAILQRPDGGQMVSTDAINYNADTLLNWTGTDAFGHNYDLDGYTTATLNGLYSGPWSQKTYTDPTTGNPFTVDDVTVTWGGSLSGGATFATPNPRNVRTTSYSGKMPDGNDLSTPVGGGASVLKTQTWTYGLKDNQDGSAINLTCKWTAHHIHENLQWLASLTQEKRVATTTWVRLNPGDAPVPLNIAGGATATIKTVYSYNLPDPSNFSLGIYHIDSSEVQSQFGQFTTLTWPAQSVTFAYQDLNATTNIGGAGAYTLVRKYQITHENGTADYYTTLGKQGAANIVFTPASSATSPTYIVCAPGDTLNQ